MAVTLSILGVVAAIAGTAVSYVGAQQQAKAARKEGEYNAAVQRNNATAAMQQAQFDASRIRDRNRRLYATSQAALLKNGVAAGGSGDDILYDQSIQGELDAMAAMYTGRISAQGSEAGAKLTSIQADNAASSARMSGYGTLLTGAGTVISGSTNVLKTIKNPQFN